MNYYTSDLHFGYEKVIQTAHRPFSSCKEMNDTLVRNINEFIDIANQRVIHFFA